MDDLVHDTAAAQALVEFWRDAGPEFWFAKDPTFDALFRKRFIALHEQAAAGALAHWADDPIGALALVLLLDQFPRNAFRGTPRMYASDAAARAAAAAALAARHDADLPEALRIFLVLPFAHSERLEDQERSVELATHLGHPHQARGEHHRDIVSRFGRFPHRNEILGRASTDEERRYLDAGGYRG